MALIGQHIRPQLERVSHKLTKLIAIHWGERFPFWYVCEYPKSGGTWLSRMVADYLDVSFPQHSLFPLGIPCVVQNHWRYHPALRRCLYLYRDGRDVMVSYYFMRMRGVAANPPTPFYRHMKKVYEKAIGRGFDPHDAVKNMPRFIEVEMVRPRGARIVWPHHIEQWHHPDSPNIACLSYEELLRDSQVTLTRCLGKFLDDSVDQDRLKASIHRYEFSRMTGRAPGDENRNSAIRKGVAGDWVNYFSKEAAEVFDHYAGTALIELKYEPDRSWLTNRDFVT